LPVNGNACRIIAPRPVDCPGIGSFGYCRDQLSRRATQYVQIYASFFDTLRQCGE